MAKVSVIMPVYNAEQTLSRSLDALCAQTYSDFEVLCVNDGSKDSSLKILKDYHKKDSRIKVLSQRNSGPGKARNYAISKSTGKYLMFCDADDWYEPQMIEQMVKTIEEQNVDIVMCDCMVHDLSDCKVHSKYDLAWHRLRIKGYVDLDSKIKDSINCVIWNKIFRKDLIKKNHIIYPKKYEHDDAMFFWKYIFASSTYYGLDKKLYNYVAGNPNSISGKYRTKVITPHMFDFILSMQDLYKFIRDTNFDNDYREYFRHNYSTIKIFYNLLSEEAKRPAFKVIQKVLKKYISLLSTYNEKFDYLANVHTFEYFNEYLSKDIQHEEPKKMRKFLGFKYEVLDKETINKDLEKLKIANKEEI